MTNDLITKIIHELIHMKLIYYLKYFFFIGINWNFPLAFFTICHEIKGERKYNLNTTGLDRLRTLSIKGDNLAHASIYQASNYYILEKGFNYLRSINENNNITDFGCGKGRALVVAAYFGFQKYYRNRLCKGIVHCGRTKYSKGQN